MLKKPLLLWESILTFLTICSASLSLANIVPSKDVALMVIVVQALNGATVVYKTGQWNAYSSAIPQPPSNTEVKT